MNKITAIIVVDQTTPHFFEAIDSVANFAKEIVVGDIGMNPDLKRKLKENDKITIITLPQPVSHVELVREKLKQSAHGDYILFLDPDESLPSELKQILNKKLTQFDYFRIPRKNIIFGKWIRHSRWWPDYQIRLFKKNKVRWPTQIHTQPVAEGTYFTVEEKESNAIVHKNYESVDQYIEKMRRYAKVEAKEFIQKKEAFSLTIAIKKALSEFMSRYFANEGYKDGTHGFVLAVLQMFYYFLVYFYFWELKQYAGEENTNPQVIQSFFKFGYRQTNHWFITKKLISSLESIRLRIVNVLLMK